MPGAPPRRAPPGRQPRRLRRPFRRAVPDWRCRSPAA